MTILRRPSAPERGSTVNGEVSEVLSGVTVVTAVVQMLLSFLPADHSRLGARIEEALDLPLIQQQAENGVLDIGRLSQFIIWTMGSLCAPCRDEDIKRLKEITDIVPLLRSVRIGNALLTLSA